MLSEAMDTGGDGDGDGDGGDDDPDDGKDVVMPCWYINSDGDTSSCSCETDERSDITSSEDDNSDGDEDTVVMKESIEGGVPSSDLVDRLCREAGGWLSPAKLSVLVEMSSKTSRVEEEKLSKHDDAWSRIERDDNGRQVFNVGDLVDMRTILSPEEYKELCCRHGVSKEGGTVFYGVKNVARYYFTDMAPHKCQRFVTESMCLAVRSSSRYPGQFKCGPVLDTEIYIHDKDADNMSWNNKSHPKYKRFRHFHDVETGLVSLKTGYRFSDRSKDSTVGAIMTNVGNTKGGTQANGDAQLVFHSGLGVVGERRVAGAFGHLYEKNQVTFQQYDGKTFDSLSSIENPVFVYALFKRSDIENSAATNGLVSPIVRDLLPRSLGINCFHTITIPPPPYGVCHQLLPTSVVVE
jgi:hypothetical protein